MDVLDRSHNLYSTLPATPQTHFSLYFYVAVLRLIEHASQACGSRATLFSRFPFLEGYWNEVVALVPGGKLERPGAEVEVQLHDLICAWEAALPRRRHIPLKALGDEAGIGYTALGMLLGLGLVEEDARFGLLFESLQGISGQRGPLASLLSAWWNGLPAPRSRGDARTLLRELMSLGLVDVLNPDAPRGEWSFQVLPLVWDALRGEPPANAATWARYRPAETLSTLEEVILPDAVSQTMEKLLPLLKDSKAGAVIVRGPKRNGRRTLVGALCRTLGYGLLEVEGLDSAGDRRWRAVGPLATLLHAVPLVIAEPTPGETIELPALTCYTGPVAVVMGRQGCVSGPLVEQAITVQLDMPGLDERMAHWRVGLGNQEGSNPADLFEIGERFRMTSGNIRRAAPLALWHARLEGRECVKPEDVRKASRSLSRATLETLATHLPALGDWGDLAVGEETMRELLALERRCRHRERLGEAVNGTLRMQLNAGVRALFTGPSGTGKTLAARILASMLGMDLYRLDLSSVINKYIGETEKNLERVFAHAEELDVMLLLDEGDALLTGRTGVQSSNDRYANLETNFLLQRLETFEGILVVTTNAAQRIDSAFQRRMDVVISFHAPDVAERWAIWQMHLPPTHAAGLGLLEEVARQCVLTGGQMRNAVLHAASLALDEGGPIRSDHLEVAVQREYRKMGAASPLRRSR